MSALGRIITSAAIGGLVLGGALGFFTASDPEPGTLALDAVPVYLCPGEGEVGTLHRGDRVLVTGRSGDWLAVRNVRGANERVFIRSGAVVPDSDLSGLPEVDCDPVGSLAVATTTSTAATTTTTAAPEESTTTSTSSTTTTTTTTTTPTSTTTTSTTVPAPSVGQVSASPTAIWEKYIANNATCEEQSLESTVSTISAPIAAPAGVQTVTMTWSSSLGGGSKQMSGPSPYSATLGPFDDAAVPSADFGATVPVTVVVTVTDSFGRQASSQTTVTLHGC